jgi:hypothetical protein
MSPIPCVLLEMSQGASSSSYCEFGGENQLKQLLRVWWREPARAAIASLVERTSEQLMRVWWRDLARAADESLVEKDSCSSVLFHNQMVL